MIVTEFTPLSATIGGVLIGIAAVLLMAFEGRIAGISGIVGRLFPPFAGSDALGAAAFLLGLIAAPLAYDAAASVFIHADRLQRCRPDGGCRTPGRLRRDVRRRLHQRPRCVRLGAAVVPFALRHRDLHGSRLRHGIRPAPFDRRLSMGILVNALAGLIFGLGLLISGMANPAKVQNFLDLAGSFDPSLIFVMAGAVIVTFAGYRLLP